jgi:hypothetical protein
VFGIVLAGRRMGDNLVDDDFRKRVVNITPEQ